MTTRKTLAYWIALVFSPPLVTAFLMLSYAYKIANSKTEFWYWGGIAFFCTIIFPSFFIVWGFLTGRYADLHLERREDRLWPLIAAISGTIGATWILMQSNAPYYYVVLMISVLVNLVVMGLITFFWKISIHTATLASSCVAGVYLFGWIALYGFLLIPIVMWSRLERKKHTPAQALAGVVVAALVTATVFYSFGFTPPN